MGNLFTGSWYVVDRIDPKDAKDLVLNVHYLHRMPQILWSFGLFRDGDLVGVCTYGRPASPTACTGVCGKENAHRVYELNRLVLRDNLKNEASMLVGRSLKMLPNGTIVVSYADSREGHVGYVYQATNWIYAGLSDAHVDKSGGGMHSRHHWVASDPGRPRPRKHRYVYFVGDKKTRALLRAQLRWREMPYPKAPADEAESMGVAR